MWTYVKMYILCTYTYIHINNHNYTYTFSHSMWCGSNGNNERSKGFKSSWLNHTNSVTSSKAGPWIAVHTDRIVSAIQISKVSQSYHKRRQSYQAGTSHMDFGKESINMAGWTNPWKSLNDKCLISLSLSIEKAFDVVVLCGFPKKLRSIHIHPHPIPSEAPKVTKHKSPSGRPHPFLGIGSLDAAIIKYGFSELHIKPQRINSFHINWFILYNPMLTKILHSENI